MRAVSEASEARRAKLLGHVGAGMTREDVLKVVKHTGDCYRIKSKHREEPFNLYVSRIGSGVLEQSASDLPLEIITFEEIESVEAY
jgi:hypothetical protein